VGWDTGDHQDGLNKKRCDVWLGNVWWVVLSKEQREILCELSRRLGTSESETLRMAFMDYAKELSMVRETLHKGKG
jgi:hypothetical protein